MDDPELRSIILNLHRRLSDHDRHCLHFYLKNHVPRSIGDDSTLSGTLKLMDSLFDQAKITEQDFTFLINAFKQIECFDAVKLLKQHERRMLLSGLNHSTQSLANMMPPIVSEFIDEDENDTAPTENLLTNQIHYVGNNNNIRDSNNITINPIRFDIDRESISSPRKQLFRNPSLKSKCLIFGFLFFILTSGIMVVFLVLNTENNHRLKDDLQEKNDLISEIRNQNNYTMKDSNSVLLGKIETIQQLTKQLTDSEKERGTIVIKAGRKFGGPGGGHFDDSSALDLTTSHYLSGLIISNGTDRIDACQFVYRSSANNQSRMESNIHGNHGQKIHSAVEYDLNQDERIYVVQVNTIMMQFTFGGNKSYTTEIIINLQFFTNKGRSIPPNTSVEGNVYTERFNGYTLGYATGRAGLRIDQIQFFWYRTT